MTTGLENLSKQELIQAVIALQNQQQELQEEKQTLQEEKQTLQEEKHTLQEHKTYLEAQVNKLQRMLFGQKRERFESVNGQMSLPFEAAPAQVKEREQVLTEKIEYVRKKQSQEHKGRLPLPDHLPVEEIEIHPDGDLSEMTCIGKEITEELEAVPARFFIRRYIRYKYAPKNKEGVIIGALPERVIDKGIPGTGLLALILTDKYLDHLPLYRQRQRFLREKIPIPSSTLEGWAKAGMDKLEILYQQLLLETKSQGYLQVDETPIKVLESDKKGACHQGYYWVYHNPIDKTVLFDYQPTRGAKGPAAILSGFKGYLQTDGYAVYEKIAASRDITHLACWAHARREFERAKDNDKAKAEKALGYIQELYLIEAKARDENYAPQQRKELRLTYSLPILNELGKWISEEVKNTLPKSQIGKAMRYSIERWDALTAYLYDGILEIDNNLVENAIRPVALGRKNYLFAGSHQAAQRAAMIYSFFAICKKHNVNPFEWLKYVLENIMSTSIQSLGNLYPQNFLNKM
jgi:transposase